MVKVALNCGEIELLPKRVSNNKLFINKYNWKEINYLSKIDDQKTFEKIIQSGPILELCWVRLSHQFKAPSFGKNIFVRNCRK